MKKAVFIRRYHPRDFPDVIEVFLRSVTDVAAKDYNQAQTRAWAQIDEQSWMTRLSHVKPGMNAVPGAACVWWAFT